MLSPTPVPMKLFLVLGLVESALLAGLGWMGGRTPVPALLVFSMAFAVYLVAWRIMAGTERSEGHLRAVWALAVLMRLALLPLEPALSDDVYRYLWDGHVQLNGVNPYLHAPDAPELVAHRTPWHSLINNPGVPTIYPPVAQFAFLVIGLLGSSVVAAKMVWLAFDLACAWLLIRVARRTGRHPGVVGLLYLWSPLLVVETAWSGHLEPLGLAAMAAVLLASHPGRTSPADSGAWRPAGRVGAALAVSALVKFAPLAAGPALLRRHGVRFALAVLAVMVLGYLPYAGAGAGLWTGLTVYAEHWRFNDGLFVLLDRLFVGPLAPRWAAAAIVLGVMGWTVRRRMDAEQALTWVLGTGIALSPTVHPWYVLWMLPLAALRSNWAWLYLSGSVFLAYWGSDTFRSTGVWPEPVLVRLLIWMPFFLLLLWKSFPAASPAERREAVGG